MLSYECVALLSGLTGTTAVMDVTALLRRVTSDVALLEGNSFCRNVVIEGIRFSNRVTIASRRDKFMLLPFELFEAEENVGKLPLYLPKLVVHSKQNCQFGKCNCRHNDEEVVY